MTFSGPHSVWYKSGHFRNLEFRRHVKRLMLAISAHGQDKSFQAQLKLEQTLSDR